jgi:hypothetical protein
MGANVMAKEDEYRRLADECLILANKIDSKDARAFLVRMAEAWLRVADQERPAGPQRRQIQAKV